MGIKTHEEFMNKKRKRKTEKKRNINKKLLKKFYYENDPAILDENIKILFGGDKKPLKPSKMDTILFGYDENDVIDGRSTFETINDNVTGAVSKYASIADAVAATTALRFLGYEGKTSEEVAEKLKNNSRIFEEINDHLETSNGKKMVGEFKKLTGTVAEVIGESIQKLPDKVKPSFDKLAKNSVDAAANAISEFPGPNVIVGTMRLAKNGVTAVDEIVKASGEIAELAGETAQELKEPMDEIKDKIEEIPKLVEMPPSEMPPSEMPPTEEKDEKNVVNQLGGKKSEKLLKSLQYGGRKIKKRVNATRHAFKNISKHLTQKKR